MKVLNLSPECFVEIVVLALYWEHWPPKRWVTPKGNTAFRDGWSTVDHIMKVYAGLGAVTEAQVRLLVQHRTNGRDYQRRLVHHCDQVCSNDSPEWSWMRIRSSDVVNTVDPRRLVRDIQIELLSKGARVAEKFEQKYEELSKDAYLREVERIDRQFGTPAASACASTAYRRRVERQINE